MAHPNNTTNETKAHNNGTIDYSNQEASHDFKDIARGELATLDAGYSHVIADLPHAEGKRALRKIDYRLVPLLAVLYLVAFIDRSNIGNARIAGLTTDLKLAGLQQGLYAARWFLGIAEAGFFPGATFLLTLWYKRYEVQSRMAVFYTAASLSGAFSGLLAFAIEKMDGIAGRSGWQWIFILEGLVPIALSFVIWRILPDNPETARFLDKKEKEYIINRLALETGSGHGRVTNTDKIKLHHIWAAFKEYKIWCSWVMFWANTIGVYGFTATVPAVIQQLGYSSANAQLLTIPIYVFAMIMTIIFAFWSDRVQQRSPFIMVGFSFAAAGFIGQLAIPHTRLPGLTYGFLFPVAAGLYCPFIHIVCWTANNLAPSSKRAVGMGLLISVGNLGGIAGSNIYIASQAPKYPTGFGVGLGMSIAAVIMAYVLRKACERENKARQKMLDDEGEEAVRARYSEQELLDMGDKSPFFIYTL
ncbi:hypothetical protein Q7P37_003375 [Cladosporium fusiforme]